MDITVKTTRYVLKDSAQFREWGRLDEIYSRKIASRLNQKAIEFGINQREVWLLQSQNTGEIYDAHDISLLRDDDWEHLDGYEFSGDDLVLEVSLDGFYIKSLGIPCP